MAVTAPNISIIIPHWNGIEVLSECLSSILKSNFNSYEIIVVDNNSTDGSQKWIKENYPDIHLIENDSNHGYAGGCNNGADAAKGEYVLFLNNDTIHEPDWLAHLLKSIERGDNIAAIQPKILNYYEKNIFDYAGGSGGAMDIFCYPFARGRLFLEKEHDTGQYDDAKPCFWASGTSMMVNRDLFFKAGKFDETFFAHMEEIDLCWKLHAMGYAIWVEPKSVVFHKNAVSLPMYTQQKHYLNHRNSLLMLLSNYSFINSFYFGTLRIILEFTALFYAAFKIDYNHFSGILRALVWVLLNPGSIVRRRRHFKKIRSLDDKEILKKLCRTPIVLAHFISGKKTYSDIFRR